MSGHEKYELFGISGRVALITGGNRNIGRSIATTLAKAGATVIVLFGSDEKAAVSELAGYTTGQEIFAAGGSFPLVRQPWDEYPAEEF